MVKGTSRTVIEINDTGNKMIERIVLFVKPEYGNFNVAKLKKEANIISDSFIEEKVRSNLIRHKYIVKRRKTLICIVSALVIAAIVLAVAVF